MKDSLVKGNLGLRDAASVCDLPSTTLASWIARNKIRALDALAHGTAGNYRFSGLDLIQVKLMGCLADFGIPLNAADAISRDALDKLKLGALRANQNIPRSLLERLFMGRILIVTRGKNGAFYHEFFLSDEFFENLEPNPKYTFLAISLEHLADEVITARLELSDDLDEACA